MATLLEILKFNLQEREYPYFEDSDLGLLLETNDNDVKKASYKGCLLKAAADDELEISGVKLSSNREYWLTLAKSFQADIATDLAIKTEASNSGYKTSMRRVDGC